MMDIKDKITEQPSSYHHLEQMSVSELLQHINEEDCRVADAVNQALPQIEAFVQAVEIRMKRGGRLFYIGAGTSGRLGVLDASELPPTFGVSPSWVIGLIAGGDQALRHAVEGAEDDTQQGWNDLLAHQPAANDTILAIAASGTTPYVIGALMQARQHGLLTACITSNPNTPLAAAADYPIETIVGPEFVTGSSRMKSGTAQKMVLNMISTTLMIRMGRIRDNRMVNMQLTNAKLVDRGTRMLQELLGLNYQDAQERLLQAGSVSDACQKEPVPQLLHYELGSGAVAFSTTRHGGFSTDRYGEFNINVYCGDDSQHISQNRTALCKLLGIDDSKLIMPHQVHLTEIAVIDDDFLSLSPEARYEHLEGIDALMTNLADVCIGVSTADCIPVLLYDEEHHAASAIHAGWRGTLARIVKKAVTMMVTAYHTRPDRLKAQIGPGISLDSFEVGDEVYDAFADAGFPMEQISRQYPSADGGDESFALDASPSISKWHIDLPACNRLQLIEAGLLSDHIAQSEVCTYQQYQDFFSARRLGVQSGRIFTGILLPSSKWNL
jgi:N-acetylmuramic acid 6-phosphate etherase